MRYHRETQLSQELTFRLSRPLARSLRHIVLVASRPWGEIGIVGYEVLRGRRPRSQAALDDYDERTLVVWLPVSFVYVGVIILQFLGSESYRAWLEPFDWFMSAVFLVDYLVRIKIAPDRWVFAKRLWNIMDLFVIAAPVISIFTGRMGAGVLRLVRICQAVCDRQTCLGWQETCPAGWSGQVGGVIAEHVFLATLAVLAQEEQHPDSPIHSPWDAAWWAVVTMFTVGYGDTYPHTPVGKVSALFVMFAGIALFGWVTAPGFPVRRIRERSRRRSTQHNEMQKQLTDSGSAAETVLRAPSRRCRTAATNQTAPHKVGAHARLGMARRPPVCQYAVVGSRDLPGEESCGYGCAGCVRAASFWLLRSPLLRVVAPPRMTVRASAPTQAARLPRADRPVTYSGRRSRRLRSRRPLWLGARPSSARSSSCASARATRSSHASGLWTGLVDGGPPGSADEIEAVLRKTLDTKRLDALVVTHPHEDHIGGLPEIVSDYRPKWPFCPRAVVASTYRSVKAQIKRTANRTVVARQGSAVQLRQDQGSGPLTAARRQRAQRSQRRVAAQRCRQAHPADR